MVKKGHKWQQNKVLFSVISGFSAAMWDDFLLFCQCDLSFSLKLKSAGHSGALLKTHFSADLIVPLNFHSVHFCAEQQLLCDKLNIFFFSLQPIRQLLYSKKPISSFYINSVCLEINFSSLWLRKKMC